MGLFQTAKPKSAGKVMVPGGPDLNNTVLATLDHIAKMVGKTLGPGGRQVLLERPEMNMKPIITKDGVTVIKHLGYTDSVRQLILESARDASMRTASEAGDGTTTATVLSSSIARQTSEQSNKSPYSPQKLVREMQALLPFIMEKVNGYKVPLTVENYAELLLRVATLSGNGDQELAASVIEAFDTVGEEGNMTIVEKAGETKCTVERISGYTVDSGYEDSAKQLGASFVNDRSGTAVELNQPIMILFNGIITDSNQILDALNRIGEALQIEKRHDRNIIIVANGFNDTVIGDLQINWNDSRSNLKVYPVITPKSAIANSETGFLHDLQTYTGSPVFNPINRPLTTMDALALVKSSRTKSFEATRFRSSVVAEEDQGAIEMRVEELKAQKKKNESEYELKELEVRIGKLTSGIARLNIYGPTSGETRERRDRAEDAWCAIRGAIHHGVLPGGGYTLVRLSADLSVAAGKLPQGPKRVACEIISQSLLEPVRLLYLNYGDKPEEVEAKIQELLNDDSRTFDLLEQRWVQRDELLDSAPAVIEAIRNSLSIASLLGTLGGVVAFDRDLDADREEQQFARRFERSIGENQ